MEVQGGITGSLHENALTETAGLVHRSALGDQTPYHTISHPVTGNNFLLGAENGQRGSRKTTLVYLEHAGAGMKQRVQYRGRDLTTAVEHEVGDERCTVG